MKKLDIIPHTKIPIRWSCNLISLTLMIFNMKPWARCASFSHIHSSFLRFFSNDVRYQFEGFELWIVRLWHPCCAPMFFPFMLLLLQKHKFANSSCDDGITRWVLRILDQSTCSSVCISLTFFRTNENLWKFIQEKRNTLRAERSARECKKIKHRRKKKATHNTARKRESRGSEKWRNETERRKEEWKEEKKIKSVFSDDGGKRRRSKDRWMVNRVESTASVRVGEK